MRLTKKAVVPAAALVMAAGVMIAYHAANGTEMGTTAQPSRANGPAVLGQVAHASMGDPGDPATWRLPIEAYMPAKAQERLVTSTRDELIDQCMDKAGYPAWKPAPDLPAVGGKTLTDWRYGIHDVQIAAKRGYHPDADEQKAYDEAMRTGAVDTSGAPDDAVRACVAQVDRQVPVAQPAEIVQQISGDAFTESQKDPKVVAVFAKWSSCMKEKGYIYSKPLDASDDPHFNDPGQVTQLEIKTAEADITCRGQYNVARTWFDTESAIQRAKIADHLKEVTESAKATREAVARAKAV
ncbi:hypothetical protein ACH4FE_06580 [Streptomyces celluloflavus]|uniref:hypothetical protein n=1 Tax=Streptomyces celluloflavus TaxID=58344 RepID=UPI0037BCE929